MIFMADDTAEPLDAARLRVIFSADFDIGRPPIYRRVTTSRCRAVFMGCIARCRPVAVTRRAATLRRCLPMGLSILSAAMPHQLQGCLLARTAHAATAEEPLRRRRRASSIASPLL